MENESLIDGLLDQWETAYESGKLLTAKDLCSGQPELEKELAVRIQALLAIDGLIDPEGSTAFGISGNLGNRNDPCRLSGKFINDKSNLQVDGFFRKGGVGAIYYATQVELGRNVALKAMLPASSAISAHDRELAVERFQTEAEITSRLEHPGIIPIYGQGSSEDGIPFYTMRFVQDSCLDDLLTDFHSNNLLPNESEEQFLFLLQNFSAACKTIAYVHSRGIVHRDIKPQNILVGKYGETLVIDWGLARSFKRTGQFKTISEETLDLGEESTSEISSDKDGTIAYMSPQQHQGRIPAPADDIYSLGATLYKILCGKSPVFQWADLSIDKVRTKVIDGDLYRPNHYRSEISPEVQSICEKAMNGRSTDRYQTALELALDIDHYIAGQPVSTYREPALKTAMRWLNRNLLTTKLLGSGLVAATIGLLCLTVLFLHSSSQNKVARQKNLLSLASSYAGRVGQDLDTRIRILEKESQSPKLIELVNHWNTHREEFLQIARPTASDREKFFGPLMKWSDQVAKKYDGRENQQIAFKALCVYDQQGTMIARLGTLHDMDPGGSLEKHNSVTEGSGTKILGQNFSFRDYFHAKGYDLDKPKTQPSLNEKVGIHSKPFYISSVYRSRSNGDFHFQVTVPIFPDPGQNNQKPIGLLGLAMQIGQMDFPENGIVISNQNTKENSSIRVEQNGLVVHGFQGSVKTKNLNKDSLKFLTRILQQSSDRSQAQLIPQTFHDPSLSLPEGSLLSVSRVTIPSRKTEQDAFLTNWILLAVEDLKNE